MNPLGIARTATDLIVSIGAGAVVGNAIKISTPAHAKLLKRVSIGVGGFVLSSMVGDMATTYTNRQIDEVLRNYKETKETLDNSKKELN